MMTWLCMNHKKAGLFRYGFLLLSSANSGNNSSNKDSSVDKVVCISYQDHGLDCI